MKRKSHLRPVESTLTYPGLRPVPPANTGDKTEYAPVPAHVIAAARAADAKGRARQARIRAQKWIVGVYRTVGFALLTVIVLGLVSYVASNVFYLFSSSWVTPSVISPTDEHVLQLNARLAEQSTQRDKLTAERALYAAQLADVDRVVAMDEKFQESFRRAIDADVADRRAQLRKLKALAKDYVDAKHEIGRSNLAYAGMSRERNEELKHAGLLDQEGYLTGNYQLSQMAHANLQLAEKSVELDTRAAALEREARALTSTLGQADGALSYDALRLKQEYQRASLELEKARDTRKALGESLGAADRSIARYDKILTSIKEAPLLVAAEGKVDVVLVPYENLASVKKGGPLYACALGFVGCHRVGTVVEVLPGEMEVRHPFHSTRQLRGQAVQVQLSDPRASAEAVLFAGGKPFGI